MNEEYLSKVLDGKQGDFDESSLICELDPVALANTIKYLYSVDTLTPTILKLILKEGAKFNQVLRMKEEGFD